MDTDGRSCSDPHAGPVGGASGHNTGDCGKFRTAWLPVGVPLTGKMGEGPHPSSKQVVDIRSST